MEPTDARLEMMLDSGTADQINKQALLARGMEEAMQVGCCKAAG